ncbi:MFS transporter [Rothia sp. AR01]|uniref:MFS transporter n=1 Tax=Rothia santali TaxID=2949643 RepID=A0A9X2HKB0_9MICC|nr:MFS transporter [Rothia santali]MCP3425848.1 MFS transporter [Rothia santali]
MGSANTEVSSESQRTSRRAALATFLGSTVEFYDLVAYGSAAAIVFAPLFFSNASPAVGTALSFATFAVGYLTRPIGAAIFGHIADTRGRRVTLLWTMYLMGGSTVLIGLLPDYDAIGDISPLLLVSLRVIQGIAIGGEQGGAMALVVEHASAGRKGFFSSFSTAGTQAGTVLASGAFALVALLPDEQFHSWGWRVPFLLSAVIVFVAIYIRRNLPESLPENPGQVNSNRTPLVKMFRQETRPLTGAFLVYCSIQVGWYLLTVFGITYAVSAGVDRSTMLWIVAGAALTAMCMNPFWGVLSDRIGRRRVMITGLLAYCLFIWLYFLAVHSGIVPLVFLSMVATAGLGHAALNGVTPSFFMESMSSTTRATTAGMAIQFAGVVGGFAPLVATTLASSNLGIWLVGLTATGVFLFSGIGTFFLKARN